MKFHQIGRYWSFLWNCECLSAGASIPSYIEVSVLCLYGDILPSDSKAMDWCKGIFWQIHNSQIFYALNFILLFIGAVYMLDKHFLFCLLIFLNWVNSSLVLKTQLHLMLMDSQLIVIDWMNCKMWDGFNTELRSHTHYGVELQNQLNNLEMNLSEINIYLKDYIAIKAVQRVYGNIDGYIFQAVT